MRLWWSKRVLAIVVRQTVCLQFLVILLITLLLWFVWRKGDDQRQLQPSSITLRPNLVSLQNDSNGPFLPKDSNRTSKEEALNSPLLTRISTRNARIKSLCLNFPNEEIVGGKKLWMYHLFKKEAQLQHLRPKHDLLIGWCPVFKAGSSAMMSVFAKLRGALTNHTEWLIQSGKLTFVKLAKSFRLNIPPFPRPSTKSLKLLVVRHPFDRIVSGFIDKLERVEGRSFYSALREKIRNRFPIPGKANVGQNVEFHSFVQYLVSKAGDLSSVDEHWRPIHLECLPCKDPFDIVLKVEELGLEASFFIRHFFGPYLSNDELSELVGLLDRWNNSISSDHLSYFAHIPISLSRKLYEAYKKDFELFAYSPSQYFSVAIKS